MKYTRDKRTVLVFETRQALCFSGDSRILSIEGIQIAYEEKWERIKLKEILFYCSDAVLVPFKRKIILFGRDY